MLVQSTIEQKISQALSPELLVVKNESHLHSVPPNSETHFNLTIVSVAFAGKRQVARHQLVYQCLQEELAGPVHALALHTYTISEWEERGEAIPSSPDCLGGSKNKE